MQKPRHFGNIPSSFCLHPSALVEVSVPLRGSGWLRRDFSTGITWGFSFPSPCGVVVGCDGGRFKPVEEGSFKARLRGSKRKAPFSNTLAMNQTRPISQKPCRTRHSAFARIAPTGKIAETQYKRELSRLFCPDRFQHPPTRAQNRTKPNERASTSGGTYL